LQICCGLNLQIATALLLTKLQGAEG